MYITLLFLPQSYHGPLLSLEHICDPGESLTGFIFTKYILAVHAEMYSMSADKGRLVLHSREGGEISGLIKMKIFWGEVGMRV